MLEWIEIEATWCCSVPYLEVEQSPLAANRHDMSLDWLKANDIPLTTASKIWFDPHPLIGVDVNFNVTKGEFSLIANWWIIMYDSNTVLFMERSTPFVFYLVLFLFSADGIHQTIHQMDSIWQESQNEDLRSCK